MDDLFMVNIATDSSIFTIQNRFSVAGWRSQIANSAVVVPLLAIALTLAVLVSHVIQNFHSVRDAMSKH